MTTWLTAFLDLDARSAGRATEFWVAVTGYRCSPRRGEHDQFTTLLPPAGDAHLRIQTLDEGPSRIHLDLHADAAPAGARTVAVFDGCTVLRSPGRFVFCVVDGSEAVPAASVRWPGGHRSIVDQVCLDIPAAAFDRECDFWAAATGWAWGDVAGHPEFRRLAVPDPIPLRVLMQRLDEPDGPVRAHLDLATDDRAAETARHVALGARVVERFDWWTVLDDPTGLRYCVTDRVPAR